MPDDFKFDEVALLRDKLALDAVATSITENEIHYAVAEIFSNELVQLTAQMSKTLTEQGVPFDVATGFALRDNIAFAMVVGYHLAQSGYELKPCDCDGKTDDGSSVETLVDKLKKMPSTLKEDGDDRPGMYL